MGRLCRQRRPIQYMSRKNKSGCKISVARQLRARHLEVNCQYKSELHNFANYSYNIHHLVHRGARRNKTAVRGGGRPPRPPYGAATAYTDYFRLLCHL